MFRRLFMPKSNYPDWVLKYKSKGVYVNKVGDKYYLYRAHCVYDKQTKKNVRVCDGYIGRVTEKDGFIPVRDKVNGPVYVFEFGLYFFLSCLLKDVYKSLKNNKKRDSILSLSVMYFINDMDYEKSALFYIYPKTLIDHFLDETVIKEAQRTSHMIAHFVDTRIDHDDWNYFKEKLSTIHLININDKYYISSYRDDLKEKLAKYNVEVKINAKNR